MSILICMAMLMATDEAAESQEAIIDHEAVQQAVLEEFAAQVAAEKEAERLAAEAVLKEAAEDSTTEDNDEVVVEETVEVPVEEELDEPPMPDPNGFEIRGCSSLHVPEGPDDPVVEFVDAPLDDEDASIGVAIDADTFRPQWIDQPLDKSGDVHTLAVSGEPRLSEMESRDALDSAILEAVRLYVDDQVGHVDAGRKVDITLEEVEQFHLVKMQYHEDYDASVGTMELRHALLELRPDFRQEIERRWKEHLVSTRLMRTVLTVVGVMALLIIAFGFLKSSSAR